MKPTLDKHGIDFIAVGLHKQMAEDFLEKTGFLGQLVINETKEVFAEVAKAGYFSLLKPFLIKILLKALAMGLGGTVENLDGFQLGGLVVIDPPPKGAIIYQWDQPQIGVYPSIDKVLRKAIEGMPSKEVAGGKTGKIITPVHGPVEKEIKEISLVQVVSATVKEVNVNLLTRWFRRKIDLYLPTVLSTRLNL